jgi:hypothetical protein
MFYKYGGKQLYYFNTYDGSGEIDLEALNARQAQNLEISQPTVDEDSCDSCKI